MDYWFWFLLYALILIWYLIVTVIVAYRGAKDIRKMMDRIQNERT